MFPVFSKFCVFPVFFKFCMLGDAPYYNPSRNVLLKRNGVNIVIMYSLCKPSTLLHRLGYKVSIPFAVHQ